jgi:hypothetical protein
MKLKVIYMVGKKELVKEKNQEGAKVQEHAKNQKNQKDVESN